MALKFSSNRSGHQWKKAGVIFAVLAFFVQPLIALNIPSVFALGSTITVCASGCDQTTIQAGINAAAAGDTVSVAAGTYIEDIVVNKALTIVGVGAATTKIVATNANATPLTFSTSNATVDGFTITHEYTPAELATWNFNNNGVVFGQLTTGNTLQNSTVSLSRNGIYINRSSNKLINNTITDNRTGINATNTIDGTIITGNTISDNWTLGLVYYSSGYASNFDTVTVTGNTFNNNWYSQIGIKDTPASTGTLDVTGNTFSDSPVTYATSSDMAWNEPGFAAQRPVALGGSAVRPTANYYPTLRIYNSGALVLKHTQKTLRVGATQPYANIQTAVNDASAGDMIDITSDLSVGAQQTVTKTVTIDGNGHTLSPTFSKTDNSNNAAIGVLANGVTINNLVEDGTNGTNLHGINIFNANNVMLNDVTAKNNDNTGVNVNGSAVTVNNITTSGNGWHGIDVDKSGAILTVNGTSHHSETAPQIYVDSTSVGQVIDTNHQYGSKDNVLRAGDRVYNLKQSVPAVSLFDATNTQVTGNYIKTQGFTFHLSSSPDTTRYQLKYWNDIAGSPFNGQAHAWTPTNLSATGHMSTLGLYADTFTQGEGVHHFAFSACNASGVCSDFGTPFTITYDATAPLAPTNLSWKTSTNVVLTNGGATNQADGTAQWQASTSSDVDHYVYKYWNDIAGNPYKVGSEYVTTTTATSLAGAFNQGVGVHHICVAAVDAAGNTSACTSFTVTYDTTAPTITVKPGFVGDLASRTFSNVSFSLYDAYKADKYVLNGWTSDFANNNWSDANFVNIKPHLVQGTNTLTLYDVAGNSTSYVFTYDTTAPTVMITGATRASDGSYIVTGASNDTAPVVVVVDGDTTLTVTPVSGVWTVTTAVLADGNHSITASSTDAAGNKGNATPTPFTFMATTPLALSETNQNNNPGNNGAPIAAPQVNNANSPANQQLLAVAGPTPDATADNQAVLGAQDAKSSTAAASDQAVKGASDTKSVDGNVGKFFGIFWYWWLIVIAAIMALWWIIAAARRRKQDDN